MKTNTPYNKLKELAHSKESSFDNFDKVWNRIDEKLDNHQVIHKKKFWKTTAIAASVVLTTTLGFAIYFLMNQNAQPNNTIQSPKVEESVVSKEDNSKPIPAIIDEKEAVKIIEEQKSNVVDHSSSSEPLNQKLAEKEVAITPTKDSIYKINNNSGFFNANSYKAEETKSLKIDQTFFNVATVNNSNILVKGKLFDALNNQEIAKAEEFDVIEKARRSRIASASFADAEKMASDDYTVLKNKDYDKLKKEENEKGRKKASPIKEKAKLNDNKKDKDAAIQKTSPLLVIDGVPIKNEYDNETFDEEELDELKRKDNLEDVVYLKEPIYYINGMQYSEESLFGEKPTSPYYPLEKQEMTSIYILKPEKAIPIYGKKGEKGVVIITTKDGKPTNKK